MAFYRRRKRRATIKTSIDAKRIYTRTHPPFANLALGLTGQILWQAGSHDRYIRDGRHLAGAINYQKQNPVSAKLCDHRMEHPFTYIHEDYMAFYRSRVFGKGRATAHCQRLLPTELLYHRAPLRTIPTRPFPVFMQTNTPVR